MDEDILLKKTYAGIVEDNNDPKRLGRVKVRVFEVYSEIETEDIPWASPWKDLNGENFILPEKGKVVTVIFENGDLYKPEYIYSEHFNLNLENKLKSLSEGDYKMEVYDNGQDNDFFLVRVSEKNKVIQDFKKNKPEDGYSPDEIPTENILMMISRYFQNN